MVFEIHLKIGWTSVLGAFFAGIRPNPFLATSQRNILGSSHFSQEYLGQGIVISCSVSCIIYVYTNVEGHVPEMDGWMPVSALFCCVFPALFPNRRLNVLLIFPTLLHTHTHTLTCPRV